MPFAPNHMVVKVQVATTKLSTSNMARQASLKSCFECQASSSSSTRSSVSNDTTVDNFESESNSGDSDSTTQSSLLHCPVKRKKKVEKRSFKNEWKVKYMMWPVKSLPEGSVKGRASAETELMMCIHCREKMKPKSSTAMRHNENTPLHSLSLQRRGKG